MGVPFGLGTFQFAGIAGIAGAIVAGAIAWNIGHARGYDAAAKKADIVIASKNEDIAIKDADLGQCRAANASYHASVADQLRIIQADLQQNLMRQSEADKKNASADLRMLDAATKSAENARAAREAILNAVDQCVRAGVPAEFIGVLNGILPPRNLAAGSDSVSASKADH
jgi:hypothetical protein